MNRYAEHSISSVLGNDTMRAQERDPGDKGAARESLSTSDNPSLDLIKRIPVSVQVVLGSATMTVSDLMKLGRGSVVMLDRSVGEPVEVLVNGRVVARGEVVVVEEGSSVLGVSLTEIVGTPAQASSAQRVK